MAIDATAVARVIGIETKFKNLREDAAISLPQRIAVLAQGSSDSVYSGDKFRPTSATQVGARFGWGSPAHLIARQLMPANGDGVGTIPVTFYPLTDHDSGVAATGSITPSGSQTVAGSYRVAVNNVLSELFVIPVGATVATICGLIGEAMSAVLEMPVTVEYTYGTVTADPDAGNTGDGSVTALTVTGTPTPGVYSLVCNQAVADGGVFTLIAPNGGIVSSSVTMTPAPLGATVIDVGGIEFTLTDGAVDFVVGDSFAITVDATDVTLTSKWKGDSANSLRAEVLGEDLGTTFAIVQPSGGLANPDLSAALVALGTVWETMVINALNIEDTTALDDIATVGESRWGALVHKPFVAFTGVTAASVAAATSISSTRRTDRINAQLVSPGSKDLPFVVAGRQCALIARVANGNPPRDYAAQRATGLVPGPDADQWGYVERDQAVKLGGSTVEIKDDVVTISDVVTFYRPEGDPTPAYRFVVDICKVMQVIFNTALIFEADEWAGAPLIPDGQATVNPDARKPSSAKAALGGMFDSLALNAVISDAAYAKANTIAELDSQNHRRLNVQTTFKISGNVGIIDVVQNFGFYYPAVGG